MENDYSSTQADKKLQENILVAIEEEVTNDIASIKDEDSETAEFLEGVMRDYRTSQYLFLEWLNKTTPPKKVLYAGSGFDIVPKLAFGEDKVVHTSLEEYKADSKEYLPELGAGKKVIADNTQLPFGDSIFDMVLLFGLSPELIEAQKTDLARVLKEGGLIATARSILEEIDPAIPFSNFEKVAVPPEFQNRGEADAEFFIFKK